MASPNASDAASPPGSHLFVTSPPISGADRNHSVTRSIYLSGTLAVPAAGYERCDVGLEDR